MKLFFPSCSFIYTSSYLEVTALVNIVSCVGRCAAAASLFLMPPFSVGLCYVCLRWFLHSCFGKLLFCLLHLLPVWCLARGAASTLLLISRQCFPRYLGILHGILVLMLCSLGGYLTAISAFIFALSLGLSQRCCLYVIVSHHRGGDLSLCLHCKRLPGMCCGFLFMFLFFLFCHEQLRICSLIFPVLRPWFFFPSVWMFCSFCLGCRHIFSSLLNTFCNEGMCLFPSVASIFVQHLCTCVFTWLQMSAVAFAWEHGVIHSRWLPSSKARWQLKKVRAESSSQDRKGRKGRRSEGGDYHQTSAEGASVRILPSTCYVT